MNKFSGFRFRLTAWYTFLFSLAGAFIFFSFYLLNRQALYYQTDSSLVAHGTKVTEVIFRQENDMHADIAKQAFLSEFAKIPGMLVIISGKDGKVITSSTAFKEQEIRELINQSTKL